jgi:uncharacterized membrane protein YbhN (UPF0104 family)
MVVSLVLLAAIAWRTNWGEVAQRFAGLRIEMWFAAVGLLVVGLIGNARRWQLYAQQLGFERPLAQLSAYYFIGTYFNLVLPTGMGGDVVRVVYLNEQSGRKWAAFVSVLLERINGLLLLMAFACAGLVFCPFALPWWVVLSVTGSTAAALLAVLALPAVQRSRLVPAARREQLGVLVGLLGDRGLWWRTLPLSVLTQASGVLILWCLAVGIGLDLTLAYSCVVFPMVTLLLLLPISVNGMGLREAGMVLFLTPLGVETAPALTLAFLLFSVGAAVSLLGGLLYLLGAPGQPKRVPASQEASSN